MGEQTHNVCRQARRRSAGGGGLGEPKVVVNGKKIEGGAWEQLEDKGHAW